MIMMMMMMYPLSVRVHPAGMMFSSKVVFTVCVIQMVVMALKL